MSGLVQTNTFLRLIDPEANGILNDQQNHNGNNGGEHNGKYRTLKLG